MFAEQTKATRTYRDGYLIYKSPSLSVSLDLV